MRSKSSIDFGQPAGLRVERLEHDSYETHRELIHREVLRAVYEALETEGAIQPERDDPGAS